MLYFKYRVVYYVTVSGYSPVKEYLLNYKGKEFAKIHRHIGLLLHGSGKLPSEFTKHIAGKIWELRLRFSNRHHRIFYFVSSQKEIVLLSAFTKKTQKTPGQEINKTRTYYFDFISSSHAL